MRRTLASVAVLGACVSVAALVAHGAGSGRPSAGRSRTGAPDLTAATASTSQVSAATTSPRAGGPSDTEPIAPPAPERLPASVTPIALPSGPLAPVLFRIPTSAPVVFVTIDDGWFRDARVIDFVRRSHWPVSVFVIERAALGDLGYFRDLVMAGASIEDHTYDHPRLSRLDYEGQREEICRPVRDDPALFGVTPWLLRPPYGAWNALTPAAAHACGMAAVVMWDATMSDGQFRVVGGHLRRGDIVLLHFRPHLFDDLLALQARLQAAGLSVAPLESYLVPPPATATSTVTTTTTSTSTSTTSTPTTSTPPTTTITPPTTTTTPATTTTTTAGGVVTSTSTP